jgi:hypothetical protein
MVVDPQRNSIPEARGDMTEVRVDAARAGLTGRQKGRGRGLLMTT